jgi:hypothetical protein
MNDSHPVVEVVPREEYEALRGLAMQVWGVLDYYGRDKLPLHVLVGFGKSIEACGLLSGPAEQRLHDRIEQIVSEDAAYQHWLQTPAIDKQTPSE